MSRRFSCALLSLFAVFVASILVPIARADQWDKETVVTFNNPVEVPGKVLPAGTYVLKLASSESDRQIVQIFTKDQQKVLATIHAVPDYRLHLTDRTVISFDERPSGEPEALRSWFYPGENYGVRFVYPKSRMELTENPNTEVASKATAPEIIPPLAEYNEPDVSQMMSPPSLPVLANEDQDWRVLAENSGPQPTQVKQMGLPKTAGNYLILPLLGVLFLGGGSVILFQVKRTSDHNNS
jgi:hypothetical protein